MGAILLFGVNIMKSAQITNLCKKMQHRVIIVDKKDYGKCMGALAGLPGIKKTGSYDGDVFPNEMMVFSGIPSAKLDEFLAEYKAAGITPIPRKAVLTPSNVKWTAEQLYRELDEHCRI